ncbi:type I-C CRISPR-associated protein Cas5c [Thermostilla marina]
MSDFKTHWLEVWGDFACFSRPEMKVERYSYPCPTPSAARGIFEAIYFKPQFRWQIDRIELLSRPAYISLRRNEVKDKISTAAVKKWMSGKAEPEPLWADGDKGILGTDQKGRTQRQTMALRNPRFRIAAHIIPKPNTGTSQNGYDAQFERRAKQGKCFHQPCLGCREFVAFFRYIDDIEREPAPENYTQDLGWMLYDVFDLTAAKPTGTPCISVFRAKIEDGVLVVPPYDSAEVRKPDRERRAS